MGQKILITGGAGYVGSVLAPLLLAKGYAVRVVDALIFNQSRPQLTAENFEFIQADLRDQAVLKQALAGIDRIVHLAALVGEPACRKYPTLARQLNFDLVKQLNRLRGERPLVIPSSSSVYSELKHYEHCNETTVFAVPAANLPYARSKYEMEQLVRASYNTVILRPATAFGYSPRLRLDLLPNELAFNAVKQRRLELYHPYHMRTFLHVSDLARAIILVLEQVEAISGEIFNVGDKALNVTKKEIADLIRAELELELKLVEAGADPDQRNFIISYDKIAKLGFQAEVSLSDGIRAMIEQFGSIEDQPSFYNTNVAKL